MLLQVPTPPPGGHAFPGPPPRRRFWSAMPPPGGSGFRSRRRRLRTSSRYWFPASPPRGRAVPGFHIRIAFGPCCVAGLPGQVSGVLVLALPPRSFVVRLVSLSSNSFLSATPLSNLLLHYFDSKESRSMDSDDRAHKLYVVMFARKMGKRKNFILLSAMSCSGK